MEIKWPTVIRDVVIIQVLTFLGGFVFGVVGGARSLMVIAILNILCGTIGFTISGCMVETNRFKHLFVVAIGVWLTSIVNVFRIGATILDWFLAIIIISLQMGLGGGLSLIFVPPPKYEQSKSESASPPPKPIVPPPERAQSESESASPPPDPFVSPSEHTQGESESALPPPDLFVSPPERARSRSEPVSPPPNLIKASDNNKISMAWMFLLMFIGALALPVLIFLGGRWIGLIVMLIIGAVLYWQVSK